MTSATPLSRLKPRVSGLTLVSFLSAITLIVFSQAIAEYGIATTNWLISGKPYSNPFDLAYLRSVLAPQVALVISVLAVALLGVVLILPTVLTNRRIGLRRMVLGVFLPSLLFFGLQLTAVPAVSGAIAHTGYYYLDTPLPLYDFYFASYTNASVFAINGSNWDNYWVGSVGDYPTVLQLANNNLTSGGYILLKDLQKPAGLSIGANVTVVEYYEGDMKYYTNSSSGKIGDCPVTTNATLTLASGTSEQYLLNVTVASTTHFYGFTFDVTALTQNCTIRIYMSVDGSWVLMGDMTKTALSTDAGLILGDFWADSEVWFTFQSAVAEGSSRSIPYRYFSEAY